ncbi:MAG: GNAT family N-acetyltransferase [Devosia sp.]
MSLRDVLPATITSARLFLRAPERADLDQLVALANNWKVIEPTAVMPFPYRQADGEEFLAASKDPTSPLAYAITANGAFMGVVSLKFAADQAPELGYWLGEPYWGKGYAAEAATALLDAARATKKFDRVLARVLAFNTASIRVLEKSGFAVLERTRSVVERHRGKPLLVMQWSAR